MFYELKGSGDFVRITPMILSPVESPSDWESSWIKCLVSVKAGGFLGSFKCDLQKNDFGIFKDELSQLYDELEGKAFFHSLEGQIEIEIKGDGIGHFVASCCVMDSAGVGNKLEFELSFDQTIIPEMAKQLSNITDLFMVTGHR